MHRVQMVSNGIPAYQKDFAAEPDAAVIAANLASRCPGAEKVQREGDSVHYTLKSGYIRAFELPAQTEVA